MQNEKLFSVCVFGRGKPYIMWKNVTTKMAISEILVPMRENSL